MYLSILNNNGTTECLLFNRTEFFLKSVPQLSLAPSTLRNILNIELGGPVSVYFLQKIHDFSLIFTIFFNLHEFLSIRILYKKSINLVLECN